MKRSKFTIAAVYDTETTNVGEGEETRAFPILFIDNDIRDIDLFNYEPDTDDKVNFYRYESEMQDRIDEYVKWGLVCKMVPVICAYNLMFDLQPLMEELDKRYDIRANAQSSTNVYTVDLYEQDTDNILLRFWDTYHLEMRGLRAMGETCGIAKATGDWDYSLVRTPETPLTEEELFYAKRDVQVIPAYLRYLLHANEWMQQKDLGVRVITKTSIVRQMARRNIAQIKVDKKNGKKITLDKTFIELCNKELPRTFGSYALRKACFRGGWTFTAASTALDVVRNVASLDVTSMHHTFINGRFIPQDFELVDDMHAEFVCKRILKTTRSEILKNYHKPFKDAIHARIKFTNVRMKKGSCFEKWGIALESTAKFKGEIHEGTDIGLDAKAVAQENLVRAMGWHDEYKNATFAFGKLYAADAVIMHFTELELWCFSRVYDFDSFECEFCEWTNVWKRPPDFVTLQSNILYEMKNAAKFISKHYKYGEPYQYNLKGIPDGIAEELRKGTCDPEFFEAWYISTVKGMFNGIYGTMAQDIFKPSYMCDNGELVVDNNTRTNPENFEEKKPNTCRVLYTYGMRIVAGSRMHMAIAMELLYEKLGDRARVTGGDTDSMKVSCADDVTDEELDEAMKPIAEASSKAIYLCMARVRKLYPDKASTLAGIGSFEIENEGAHYEYHMEMWNKARVSWDGKAHVTCAGLPRPIGAYHIETFINELVNKNAKKYGIEYVLQNSFGFNIFVSNPICHTLETYHPLVTDMYNGDITDYQGNTTHVCVHESNSLYPTGRWLGDLFKFTNLSSVVYLREKYGKNIDDTTRYLYRGKNGRALLQKDSANGPVTILEG